jgi:hypothetical protein
MSQDGGDTSCAIANGCVTMQRLAGIIRRSDFENLHCL